MKILEIKNIIKPYILEPTVTINIKKQMFSNVSGRKLFNKKIKENVENKYGIYIWVNSMDDEIIYIGMAGRIKSDGELGIHSLQKRLLASRGKDINTKKDIQTNDFVHNYMVKNNIESLDFHIMYSKEGEPPAFIEALILYNYYKKNKRLPKLNNSF